MNEFDLLARIGKATDGVRLAARIAWRAHRDQRRRSGEPYLHHPLRMREKYLDLLGLSEEGPGDSDILLLKECGIPYEGVEELALLHDVAEDSPISLEEIGAAYGEAGMFPRYASILRPRLPLLAKRQGDDYPSFIARVASDRTASLVKMLDLEDNSRVLTVGTCEESSFRRIGKYLEAARLLAERHRFPEAIASYWKRKEP